MKESIDEFCPCPAIEFPQQRVFSVDPVTGDDVVLIGQLDEGREFIDVELSVAVGVEDPLFFRGVEAGLQGGAIPLVDRMLDESDVGGLLGEFLCDLGGLIGAAVIHDNHFVIVTDRLEHFEGAEREGLDVVLFVVTGEKDGETYLRTFHQNLAPLRWLMRLSKIG